MNCFLALTLSLLFQNNAIAVHGSSTTTNVMRKFESGLLGRNADPLVSAAPLVVGASCQDGCVLVAVHSIFANQPLLLDGTDDENDISGDLRDLPKEYRGPFRVFSVDAHGTSLACVGWRVDGQTLVDYCRQLAKKEDALYGNGRPKASEYGNYLATEASLWLARSAVSGKVTIDASFSISKSLQVQQLNRKSSHSSFFFCYSLVLATSIELRWIIGLLSSGKLIREPLVGRYYWFLSGSCACHRRGASGGDCE